MEKKMKVSRFGKGKKVSFKHIKFKMSNRYISAPRKYTDECEF